MRRLWDRFDVLKWVFGAGMLASGCGEGLDTDRFVPEKSIFAYFSENSGQRLEGYRLDPSAGWQRVDGRSVTGFTGGKLLADPRGSGFAWASGTAGQPVVRWFPVSSSSGAIGTEVLLSSADCSAGTVVDMAFDPVLSVLHVIYANPKHRAWVFNSDGTVTAGACTAPSPTPAGGTESVSVIRTAAGNSALFFGASSGNGAVSCSITGIGASLGACAVLTGATGYKEFVQGPGSDAVTAMNIGAGTLTRWNSAASPPDSPLTLSSRVPVKLVGSPALNGVVALENPAASFQLSWMKVDSGAWSVNSIASGSGDSLAVTPKGDRMLHGGASSPEISVYELSSGSIRARSDWTLNVFPGCAGGSCIGGIAILQEGS